MCSEILPLEDVVEDIIDRRGVTPLKLGGHFVSSGHRVISAKVIKGGRINLSADEPRYVDSTIYKKWMKKPLRQDDVIMTSEAPLGELAYLEQPKDWVLGQRLFAIRPKKGVLNGKFLYYVLATQDIREKIVSRASGTTVQGIRQAELRKVEIPVPPIAVQIEIAATLGSLDERIDNLRQTNATLEAIAKALFKSWFVDFDPVRAKAEGCGPEGMDAATAALFPSEFEDSELGPIPRGWRCGELRDLVELKYGKSLKADDRRKGTVPVYGSGGITGTHDSFLVAEPTVIVGRKGTVGSLYWQGEPCFPIDTVFYVVPKVSLYFGYYSMMRMGLEHLNTDAAVPGLNRENAYRQTAMIPPGEIISAWDLIAVEIRSRIELAVQQAKTLAAIRDTLLPRLISGKLRLPDAEALIKDVTA